jgi:prepilin-type N-terminal cleavage/methylation domain-containing protein
MRINFIHSKLSPEKGMTLIEVLVAIGIMVIGLGGFSLLFSNVWKSNAYSYEAGQASAAASQGVAKLTELIRRSRPGDDGSYPIQSANDNDLVIFSDYDKDDVAERLHFYKNGNDLLMGYREPTTELPKTYVAGDQAVITIAKNVINEASDPIFSYFNQNYPADQVNNPMTTPAYTLEVRMVEVLLKVNPIQGRGPENIEIRSFAEIRNLSDFN